MRSGCDEIMVMEKRVKRLVVGSFGWQLPLTRPPVPM